MKELTRLVKDFARCQGACAVGIATTETLSRRRKITLMNVDDA